jgi:hypothetical protein
MSAQRPGDRTNDPYEIGKVTTKVRKSAPEKIDFFLVQFRAVTTTLMTITYKSHYDFITQQKPSKNRRVWSVVVPFYRSGHYFKRPYFTVNYWRNLPWSAFATQQCFALTS